MDSDSSFQAVLWIENSSLIHHEIHIYIKCNSNRLFTQSTFKILMCFSNNFKTSYSISLMITWINITISIFSCIRITLLSVNFSFFYVFISIIEDSSVASIGSIILRTINQLLGRKLLSETFIFNSEG